MRAEASREQSQAPRILKTLAGQLGTEEVRRWRADALPRDRDHAMQRARAAAERTGCAGPGQQLGERWPVGCVALEITQRCNLDCTLCYLSHAAEMAHDVPLDVLFSRIDMIESHYGPGTSIQITGGDPTLRKPEDLKVHCRYIRARDMRACLMTNGIKASRELLRKLGEAGLDDVAFHVDITQERQGFSNEVSLNAVRRDYIARAKAL